MGLKQTDISLDFTENEDRAIPSGGRGPVTTVDRFLARRLLKSVGSPAVSIRLWDGSRIDSENPGVPVGSLTLSDRTVLRELVTHGDMAFGDQYSEGRLLIDGPLTDVLVELMASLHEHQRQSRLTGFPHRFAPRPKANSLRGSLDNIHHHYDIGNDFYRLWLDDAMQYTCAYYERPDFSIEQAQQAKMHHVCRKLELKPGDTVVEAGCGWGGLARHMARHYGVRVRAYNISREQVSYARECAKREGLEDQVTYIEDDYRTIEGRFDKFVSVGMLEHVGVENYPELGRVIDRCLAPNGRGLIHTIGRNAPRRMNRWIEARIFPGGYPPTLSQMTRIFEGSNFSMLDFENLRLHYATTLEAWVERYNEKHPAVREMFDERFVRMWRLYLHGSIAAFRTSSLQLFQVVFARGLDNTVPMTRHHIYPKD